MENLGKDLAGNAVQPFVVGMEHKGGSGSELIVHAGHEFAYCLSGKILYLIDGLRYELSLEIALSLNPICPIAGKT
jgi:hypothetical protein